MVAAGTALAVANATAYSSIFFDLFVAAVALLTGLQSSGWRAAFRRAATVLVVTSALLVAGSLIGGSSLPTGFERRPWHRRQARPPRCRCSPVPGPGPVCSSSWPYAG